MLLACALQTNTTKLPKFFQRFQTKIRTLWVNETKITTGKGFNQGYFSTEDNQEATNNEKTLI